MVVFIGNHDISLSRHRHPSGAVELPWSHPLAAKLVLEGAVGIEDLDAMIAPVPHDDVAVLVTADPPGSTELPALRPLTPKHLREDPEPAVLSPPVHKQRERTPLHVLPPDSDHQLVVTFDLRSEVDGV